MTEAPPPPPPGGYQTPVGYPPPKHPQATLILVLGILGLVLCQVVAPFAWVMGNKAMREIKANPTAFSGDGEVNAGRILGIIGTVLLVLAVVVFAVFVIAAIAFSAGTFDDGVSTGY